MHIITKIAAPTLDALCLLLNQMEVDLPEGTTIDELTDTTSLPTYTDDGAPNNDSPGDEAFSWDAKRGLYCDSEAQIAGGQQSPWYIQDRTD